MVFVNLGLSGARGFSVPDYIRSELARRGVPRDQIAYIYNYKSHVARQKLFNDMNDGKVRILIGSTAKMATGVNAQRRLYAIHNQDPLWYPADDEQRNGRGIRQGNTNPEIEIHDYSTKGTYDSTMWGLMEKKARFIRASSRATPRCATWRTSAKRASTRRRRR
jgi:SNF2 family DNA or RNA helicase